MAKHDNTAALYAALLSNLAIAITKFIAAWITGGSAMLSEGVHSLVDSGNEVLLLYGQKRAGSPRTQNTRWGTGASSISGASSSP